jgi:hypothetical protein
MVKKKMLKSKSMSNTKLVKNNLDITQSATESSFFKTPTCHQNKPRESVPCPLCLKLFQDDKLCTNHMKSCAKKRNISIRELLDAKRLQDRQIQERKAKGLLPTPILLEKKKVYRSKNFVSLHFCYF